MAHSQGDAIYDDLLAKLQEVPADQPAIVSANALREGGENEGARFFVRVPVPTMQWYWSGNVWADVYFPDLTNVNWAAFGISLLQGVEDEQSSNAFYLGPWDGWVSYCEGDLQAAWNAGHQDSSEHGWAHMEAPADIRGPDDPDTDVAQLAIAVVRLVFDPKSGVAYHMAGEER